MSFITRAPSGGARALFDGATQAFTCVAALGFHLEHCSCRPVRLRGDQLISRRMRSLDCNIPKGTSGRCHLSASGAWWARGFLGRGGGGLDSMGLWPASPTPPKHQKYCVHVLHPGSTQMHYVTHISDQIQKHKFSVKCWHTFYCIRTRSTRV
jgi:hypothetical protein